MKILVKELAKSHGSQWQVRLDQHAVTFRSEIEARAFVSTLQARLHAPHSFPEQQRQAVG
ncbi:hypothetical protein [Pseudomonas gingeri]|uniref:DUF2188 domain-containing protein n=1 Tax=Pseudomonas gingeri TaxID=117681 RepID=A0A7Y8CHX7_9PSED|nr:hypothetical protein [Pseudomonas gingeri]NWA00616.1 hypothetical protein [Pseudomonas gingeri]NWA14669.1 hypothetical protein [Pseudomonas gingeri]NWA56154.1 hypothetical protein [Pseudomonas gingeri]NWA96653.1 hypothetical protein [Pseudomonas gingeri]NWB03627.1 hypothetical protein [Pseudomonas gingeri]